jgi:hypothetical protein
MRIVCDTGLSSDIEILDSEGKNILRELNPSWVALEFLPNSFVKLTMEAELSTVDVEVVGEITVLPKDKE